MLALFFKFVCLPSLAFASVYFIYAKYFAKQPQQALRILTRQDLSPYNGSTNDLPIYVGILDKVYDVSKNRESYGTGQSYAVFAGKDATRALAKMALTEQEMQPFGKIDDLNEKELKTLQEWVAFYEKRYPIVAQLKQ